MGTISGLENIPALNTKRQIDKHTSKAADATKALSSGNRLTKASTDAASAAISALVDNTTRILNQAKVNANNGMGVIEVATGSLNDIKNLLASASTLAAKATDASLDDKSRMMVNNEFQDVIKQIDDVANRSRWNGVSLLSGGSNAGNIAGATVMGATGLNAPAVVTNSMAGTMSATSRGFISGSVESVSVEGSAGAYKVSMTVGGQKFVADGASPVAGGTLNLVSTVDSGSIIRLDYDAASVAGITNSTTFTNALKETLGLNAGNARASFVSQATAANNGLTGLTAGNNTETGTYAFRYDADSSKLTLTNGKQLWSQSVSTTGAAQNITFENGITVQLDNTFVVGTGITQTIFQVDKNATNSVSLTFQLAEKSTDTLQIDIAGATLSSLGLSGISVDRIDNAQAASEKIQEAVKTVNQSYSGLGAKQKRLESTIENLGTVIENLSAAKSKYQDADIAEEMTRFTQANTMAQIANVGLSQNLQMAQQLLSIVRG